LRKTELIFFLQVNAIRLRSTNIEMNKKIINGNIVESTLWCWIYITGAESALKLTRIIFGNMVW